MVKGQPAMKWWKSHEHRTALAAAVTFSDIPAIIGDATGPDPINAAWTALVTSNIKLPHPLTPEGLPNPGPIPSVTTAKVAAAI